MEKDALREEPIEFVLKDFPGTRYYPKFRLTTWHPTGILDEALAEKVIEFVEREEYIQEAPFHRYLDLSGFTEIRIRPKHIIEIARRRGIVRQAVKSAFFADNPIGLAIAQVYERLMEGQRSPCAHSTIPISRQNGSRYLFRYFSRLREQRMRVIRGLTGNRAGTDSHSSDC